MVKPIAAGTVLGLSAFALAFVAFTRGWLGVDGLLIDTLHHF